MDEILSYLDVGELATEAVAFLPRVVAAVAVFVVFLFLYRLTRRPFSSILRRAGFHEKLVELLVHNIYRYTVTVFGLVMAADQMGINVGAALAGLGVAGIALGFAAQDALANVMAGFLIFWDKPFIVRDWITTEGEYGQVTDITLRTTRIRTPRNTYVVIPNRRVIESVLVNHSTHGELRIDVPVGIAYKEDVVAAREVILAAVRQLAIRTDPAPDVVVEKLGSSSIDLVVRVWIDHARDEQGVTWQVTETAKRALDEAGIEIPFPHLQLFVEDVRSPAVERIAPLVRGTGGA
jgi:small conductance mechanosensitive channel